MNFQNIRNEFVMQCKEQEKALKESERLAKLEEELTKQYQLHSTFERCAYVFILWIFVSSPVSILYFNIVMKRTSRVTTRSIIVILCHAA